MFNSQVTGTKPLQVQWASSVPVEVPDYPIAYDAGKALNTAARASGETGYGAQWAGQGAPLSRPMGAAELIDVLWREATAVLP